MNSAACGRRAKAVLAPASSTEGISSRERKAFRARTVNSAHNANFQALDRCGERSGDRDATDPVHLAGDLHRQ